eukprot:jgi/Chrzof1/8534/Cz03g14200.t1_OSCP
MLARAAALVAGRARHVAPVLSQAPDPPISVTGIPGSIATLTWQVAAKENQLEKVQDELNQIVAAFEQQPDLPRIAVDPFLPVSAKVGIMKSILEGSQASEITKRLIISLAEENALSAILKVVDAYNQLMLAHKKEVYCTIVTAEPVDKLERQELTKQAQKFVDPGFKLVMQEKVDRKLIGGFVLEFEDRLVDMSVAKKLEEFNNLVFKLETDLRP